MERRPRVSITLKLSCVALVTALALQVVGFSTDYWSHETTDGVEVHRGLWRVCACPAKQCSCLAYGDSHLHDTFPGEVVVLVVLYDVFREKKCKDVEYFQTVISLTKGKKNNKTLVQRVGVQRHV